MNRKMVVSNFRLLTFGLLDSELRYLDTPKGELGELNLSNERIKLLSSTLKLMMETDLLSDVTRKFICGRWTNKTLAQYYKDNGLNIDVKQVARKIYYDCEKYAMTLGESFIYDLCYRSLIDLDHYRDKLIQAALKYNSENDISSLLVIKLDKCEGAVSILPQKDFDRLVEILYRCSKVYMDKLKSALTLEQLAYLSYITTYTGLEGENVKRLEELKAKLNGS